MGSVQQLREDLQRALTSSQATPVIYLELATKCERHARMIIEEGPRSPLAHADLGGPMVAKQWLELSRDAIELAYRLQELEE